jgi:hypothetical protein
MEPLDYGTIGPIDHWIMASLDHGTIGLWHHSLDHGTLGPLKIKTMGL